MLQGEISPPRSKWFAKFEAALPSLQGKVVAITGTTSGTGLIAARSAAKLGATVLLLNRKSERAEKALARLTEEVPEATFVSVECDLQSLESVRKAADTIKAQFEELDVLANNAGAIMLPDQATCDGFDVEIQTNHLSHFLLTKELMPLLEAAAEKNGEARVVQHSSIARRGNPLEAKYFEKNGGNLGGNKRDAKMERYHQTKLANMVFALALRDRLEARGSKVKSLVCHPGVSFTGMADSIFEGFSKTKTALVAFACSKLGQSVEDGAMGLLRCIASEDVATGHFYGPVGGFLKTQMAGLPVSIPVTPFEEGQEQKDLLWTTSEAACGAAFEI